ncbi:MAG: ribbon-helix-helix domain-containing protein [Candidatus Sulfotelmatobacter sp.]
MDHFLSIRITDQLAQRLAAVCDRTLIARSTFVRKAIENALDPKTGIEAMIALAVEKAAEEIFNQETKVQQS